jgi:probable rRNA maturation factor
LRSGKGLSLLRRPDLNVLVQGLPKTRKAQASVKKMAKAALKAIGSTRSELSILLTDNEGIRRLNRTYRKIDRPTDVLSFPQRDEAVLGDIVISLEKAEAQAHEFGVSLEEELGRLVAHGILHLKGYDHARGGRQALKMREKEKEILCSLFKCQANRK